MKINSEFILKGWNKATAIPCGKYLFSLIIKIAIPYTGSLGSRIQKLEAGNCEIQLKDRKGIRNHLSSIHAMALANLGEFSTGLALISGLPPDMRGILKAFQIEYLKKARGTLLAKAKYVHVPSDEEFKDLTVVGEIFNSDNEVVARVNALWRIGKSK